MTGRTQRWKEIRSERSSGIREFVIALREAKDSTALTQQQVAAAAGIAPTTFSGYLNGSRLPEEDVLTRIFNVISEDVRQRGAREAHSLDTLRGLRNRAVYCPACARRGPSIPPEKSSPEGATNTTTARQRPAPQVVRSQARKRIRLHRSRRHVISVPPPRAEVPVPPQEGDRHLTPEISGPLAAELTALRRHQAAGRTRDTHLLLWGKARSVTPGEFPETVAAYRAAGLEEEVETLLRTAASERDVHAVLNIVAALHDSHQYADAQTILTTARTDA